MDMIKHWMIGFVMLVSFTGTACSQSLPDFTELAAKQGQAVVNISATQVMQGGPMAGMPFPGVPNDEALQEFFRRFGIPGMPGMPGAPNGEQQEYKTQSLGSGFILSSDGYVQTNAHVVNAAEEIVVKLNDNREFKAKVIGADRRTDVAVLKIEASNLPTVTIGDPGALKVGEWVAALG